MNAEQTISGLVNNEYKRFCSLIDKPPYGDCEMVALAIACKTGLKIMRGFVVFEDGDRVEHCWLESEDNIVFDPLSLDWSRQPVNRLDATERNLQDVLNEYWSFINEFPEPCPNCLFPLRWALKEEMPKSDSSFNNKTKVTGDRCY